MRAGNEPVASRHYLSGFPAVACLLICLYGLSFSDYHVTRSATTDTPEPRAGFYFVIIFSDNVEDLSYSPWINN